MGLEVILLLSFSEASGLWVRLEEGRDREGTADGVTMCSIRKVRVIFVVPLTEGLLWGVALDQIITQIMENSNTGRPVPATDEIIENLPREVLEAGCKKLPPFFIHPIRTDAHLCIAPQLQKDCAVCKDQFKLETDDPDEQVVVTLPCKHPFHEGCIIPWIKSSGTCPVCR